MEFSKVLLFLFIFLINFLMCVSIRNYVVESILVLIFNVQVLYFDFKLSLMEMFNFKNVNKEKPLTTFLFKKKLFSSEVIV